MGVRDPERDRRPARAARRLPRRHRAPRPPLGPALRRAAGPGRQRPAARRRRAPRAVRHQLRRRPHLPLPRGAAAPTSTASCSSATASEVPPSATSRPPSCSSATTPCPMPRWPTPGRRPGTRSSASWARATRRPSARGRPCSRAGWPPRTRGCLLAEARRHRSEGRLREAVATLPAGRAGDAHERRPPRAPATSGWSCASLVAPSGGGPCGGSSTCATGCAAPSRC